MFLLAALLSALTFAPAFALAGTINAVAPGLGPAGTTVAVTGTGFTPSSVPIVQWGAGSSPLETTGSVSGTGYMNAVFHVPAGLPSGQYAIRVVTNSGDTTATPWYFTVTPSASASVDSGYVGTMVTVSGDGFLADVSISLLFDNAPAATADADAKGSFRSTFEVPARSAGAYKIRVTDGTNSVDLDFSVTPNAVINPLTSTQEPGYVGQPITISGVRFKAGAALGVTFDGKTVPVTGSVGSDSNFSVTFKAPASKPGQHTVTVSDGQNSVPFAFYVESTPPPAPTLTEPDTGVSQEVDGFFTWSAVTDPSGVSYDLQIASSSSFESGSLVLERTSLSVTKYTLTEADKLQPTKRNKPDYWRVRAVDGASNVGPWSNIRSFTVGTPFPAWALWTIIGLGALIIALFAFWLGRRTKASTASLLHKQNGPT